MSKRTVLFVGDEPVIRMIAVETLEDAGCSVVEFDNAEQAIGFCRAPENDIAALFTDTNLPGDLDGIDVALFVAGSHPHAVVIVTSGGCADKPTQLSSEVKILRKPWSAQPHECSEGRDRAVAWLRALWPSAASISLPAIVDAGCRAFGPYGQPSSPLPP